jgi:hypothetical protein
MLLAALHAILGVFVLAIAALGAGYFFLRWLPGGFRPWERWVLSFGGGWGLLSLVLYLIGQIYFSRQLIFVVVFLFALVGAGMLWRGFRSGAFRAVRLNAKSLLPAVFVLLIIAVTAISGLAPVTGDWGSDTVAYHLLGPKVWLRAELIRPVPDNCHTAFPQTAETMFAALYALGGASGPCSADFLTLGFLLFAAASLSTRCGLDATGAWWLAALVATMPAVFSGGHAAFVDGLYAAFFLAAVRICLDAEKFREWVAFGAFCGFTIATKYTGLLAIPILFVCVLLFRGVQDRSWSRSVLAGCGGAAAVAAIFAAPYYIRNWALLGCPIYPPPPGLVHFCSAKYLSPEAIQNFHRYILARGRGLGEGPLSFVLLPINLTYHTSNFHGAGGIGLVPLGLAPIGLWSFRRNVAIRYLALLSFLLTAAWFVTQQESRFLIHVYVMAAILGVLGWRNSSLVRGKLAKVVAGSLVAASLLYGAFMILNGQRNAVHAALSPSHAQKMREEQIPFAKSFEYLNGEPTVTKVLILDRSVPPFYLEKPYVKPVGQWGELTVPGVSSASQAVAAAKGLGVTHVLDVSSELATFQVKGDDPGLKLVFESTNQRIYRVE